jgi:hypothetical protein
LKKEKKIIRFFFSSKIKIKLQKSEEIDISCERNKKNIMQKKKKFNFYEKNKVKKSQIFLKNFTKLNLPF